ncbi:Retrovirus-related Pol polyprotein from transposon 17.6 [Araneus ventricosus]|uniref:Retrovirus-related Pol polyprotein from transposon 17.6 n=1 Tax=Araneus ventricosus TaxID=182803 RepID=A0A4Y2MLA5_ARAVE|nr:Retrovirus-related Pol polyprotein from transposon 17.6 [Araneus ventricosus]
MESRRMKPFETLREYFLAMRDLAHKGSLDDSSLIEYVINGIPDSSNNKIILYGCKSIPEFKEKLKIYEKLFNTSRTFRPNSDKKFDPTHAAKLERKRTPNPQPVCYSCGLKGHKSTQCTNKPHEGIVIICIDELDGLKRLSRVLQTVSEYGLELNLKKCNFLKSKIEFLGYIIENGEISPSLDKTVAVQNFPEPKSVKQVQSFLGLTGYFRKFIQNYALVAKPLSDLLRDNTEFYFGPEQKSAFQTLKQKLSENPVLHIFKQCAKLELHTDASKFGYGAILFQQSDGNKFHTIHYMSKTTSLQEEKYSSYELEVLTIIEALKKFLNYLVGSKFRIITDCSAFQKTMSKTVNTKNC